MTMVTALLTSVMMLAGLATATAQRRDFPERDEINQTYKLAPGARVEVSSIRGPVVIVNGDSATAEVQSSVPHASALNVTRESEEKSPDVRARIGGGGTSITISSVSGNIRLTRS